MYRFLILALAVAAVNAGYQSHFAKERDARASSIGFGGLATPYGLDHGLVGSAHGYGSFGSLGYSGYASPYSTGYASPYSAGYASPYSAGYASPYSAGYAAPYSAGLAAPYATSYGSHLGLGLHSSLGGAYNAYNSYGSGLGGHLVR